MVNSLISATSLELESRSDLLSLPLSEVTISSDRADFGDFGTLLSIIDLESGDVGLDPFLSELGTILVLQVSPASPVVKDDYIPSSGMIADRR